MAFDHGIVTAKLRLLKLIPLKGKDALTGHNNNMGFSDIGVFTATERLRLLYTQSSVAFLTALIAAGLMIFMLWNAVDHKLLSVWLTLMVIFTLGRQLLIRKFQREDASGDRVASRYKILVWLAFLAGIIWGAGDVLFLRQSPLEYQTFIILIAGGMVVGASASYAASMPVFDAFSLSTMLPIVTWCLIQPDRNHITTGFILAVFTTAMWMITARNHAMLFNSLTHEHQSNSLAQTLRREVNQRKRHQKLLTLQSRVLQTILSTGQKLKPVLDTLVLETEAHCPGMTCSILLLDHEGKHLLHGAAPHLPEAWNSVVNGMEIGPHNGSCGTAAYRRERIIVENIATDPLWASYSGIALQHGLHACWSQPVMDAENNVLGTFAMYYSHARSPSEHEIRVIESAANLAAIAIEHVRKEETLHQLVEVIPDAIVMHCYGGIVYANPAAVKLFGAGSREDMLGQPILNFVHPDMQSTGMERACRAIHTPIPLMEERLLKLDGSVFDAEVTAFPVKYKGRPAIEVIIHDLSARKKAEAETRRLQVAMEHAPEGIFIADDQGKIIYCNAAFAQAAGMRPEHMIDRYAAEFRGGNKGDADYRKILSRLSKGKSWEGEFIISTTRGRNRTVIRKVAPVIEAGETRYHVGIDFDMTEKHAQQAKLEHMQRLESLGVLAGGIAHDFNNILAAIMGNASLASMKLKNAPAVREHLRKIEASSKRAGKLCHQMLAYAGKGKRMAKPLNLSTLLHDVSSMLEVSIGKKVVFEQHLDPSLPSICADEAQIEQVMMNLITNANEAIGSGAGIITISTGIMDADTAYLRECIGPKKLKQGQYVFLAVSDNGCGIDTQTKARMFDPFFTTKRAGRGLGMSALLGIVGQHNGSIHLQSARGKGTTFKILFPQVDQDIVTAKQKVSPRSTVRFSGTALVVDDEETLRETTTLLLKHMGFDVLLAEDGQAGVEVFHKNEDRITVVLLDMNMPRMDGEEACRRMKDIRPEIPVILTSGYTEMDISHGLKEKQATAFLHKPYSYKHLAHILHRVLT